MADLPALHFVLSFAAVLYYTVTGFILNPVSPSDLVSTTCGPVQGKIENGVAIFKGIPYAKPPTGNLRWRPPQALNRTDGSCWKGTYQATQFGSKCVQRDEANTSVTTGDEDCLFINVWTPVVDPNTKLPVMVWIHGGSLVLGSGNDEPFAPNAEVAKTTEAVYVSLNYRVQALGFMALEILAADSNTGTSGNYGFMDQILALKWVKENIVNFGGDPNQVTLFGQSSGGTSVFALLASPLCQGLFHKAWLLSASPVLNKSAADAFNDNLAFLRNTQCQDVTCLRNMSAADVTAAVPWDVFPYWDTSDFLDLPTKGRLNGALAIVDGYVLKDAPLVAMAKGEMVDVPLLIGSTAQELDAFPSSSAGINWTQYEDLVKKYMTPFGDLVTMMALKFYPPGVGTPELQYTTLASNIRVSCGTDYVTTIASSSFKSPVYRYVATYFLSQTPSLFPAKYAFHGLDIVAFFGAIGELIKQPSAADLAFQRNIRKEAMAFVKTGRPSSLNWQTFPSRVAELSDQTNVTSGYKTDECLFWLTNGFFSYSWLN